MVRTTAAGIASARPPVRLPRSLKWGCILSMTVGMLAAPCATAQSNYPQRPLQLIVGYAPGGSTDACARALARGAEEVLKQPIVVQNRPGAASSIAIAWLRNQPADGYTLAILPTGAILNQLLRDNVGYDVRTDIQPVSMVAEYQVGMVVRHDSPWRDLGDVIEAARAAPGAIMYATAGQGTPQHLTMERLGGVAGVEWNHVPYKNGPEAIMALIRGDVSILAQSAEWLPYVRDGQLRLLSFFQDTRMTGQEEVATLKESGYDMSAPSILGVAVPKNTPADIVKTLDEAFRHAVEQDEYKQCVDNFGLRISYLSTDDFVRHVQETADFWEPIAKEVGKSQP